MIHWENDFSAVIKWRAGKFMFFVAPCMLCFIPGGRWPHFVVFSFVLCSASYRVAFTYIYVSFRSAFFTSASNWTQYCLYTWWKRSKSDYIFIHSFSCRVAKPKLATCDERFRLFKNGVDQFVWQREKKCWKKWGTKFVPHSFTKEKENMFVSCWNERTHCQAYKIR